MTVASFSPLGTKQVLPPFHARMMPPTRAQRELPRTPYRGSSQNTSSRDCLENRDKLHSGLPQEVETGPEVPFRRLEYHQHERSRALWPFSRQSLQALRRIRQLESQGSGKPASVERRTY